MAIPPQGDAIVPVDCPRRIHSGVKADTCCVPCTVHLFVFASFSDPGKGRQDAGDMSSLPGGYGSESTRLSTAQYRRRDHIHQEQSRLLPMLTVSHRTVIPSACYPGLSGQDCVGLRLTSAEVPAMDSTCLRFRDRIFDFGLPKICWPCPLE